MREINDITASLEHIEKKHEEALAYGLRWQEKCYDLVIAVSKFHNRDITEDQLVAIVKDEAELMDILEDLASNV